MLSNYEKGLQTVVNALSNFCQFSQLAVLLEVNQTKQKSLYLFKMAKTHNMFFLKYNNEFLETV